MRKPSPGRDLLVGLAALTDEDHSNEARLHDGRVYSGRVAHQRVVTYRALERTRDRVRTLGEHEQAVSPSRTQSPKQLELDWIGSDPTAIA